MCPFLLHHLSPGIYFWRGGGDCTSLFVRMDYFTTPTWFIKQFRPPCRARGLVVCVCVRARASCQNNFREPLRVSIIQKFGKSHISGVFHKTEVTPNQGLSFHRQFISNPLYRFFSMANSCTELTYHPIEVRGSAKQPSLKSLEVPDCNVIFSSSICLVSSLSLPFLGQLLHWTDSQPNLIERECKTTIVEVTVEILELPDCNVIFSPSICLVSSSSLPFLG